MLYYMDLVEDIKNFTAKDMQQYKELTITVRDHWLKMLENDKMPEHLRLAVMMSIKQAEADLELLTASMQARKAKIGEAAFEEELSAPNEHNSGEMAEQGDDEE
jgi:hypothetical protein